MFVQPSSVRELSHEQVDAVINVRLEVFHGSLGIEASNIPLQSGVTLYISEGKQVLQRLTSVGWSPYFVKY